MIDKDMGDLLFSSKIMMIGSYLVYLIVKVMDKGVYLKLRCLFVICILYF